MNEIFRKDGSDLIRAEIERAIEDGTRTAEISGRYEIAEAIRIPSDFTLILNNCHLRQKDGCYSNIFINERYGTEAGKFATGADKNISIIGRGDAILDGGKYNGLSEKTQLADGMPPIWKNNLILFTNVDGFRISGIQCRNQRWWALNFIYARNGYIGDVDFLSSDVGIDKDGNEYCGLRQDRYSEILIKNSDGIDIRRGCHDILIENVTGWTEDDAIALTALDGAFERAHTVLDLPTDIHSVKIRGVRASAFCTIVRLLNQDGMKLHDVEIDGIFDTGADSPHMDHGAYAVRIGDTHIYGERQSLPNETYNISINNVYGCGIAALALAGGMSDVKLGKIECAKTTELIIDKR